MNNFTLRFHDQKLERKYQENYSNELYDAFKYTMLLLSLSNIILSIFWIQRQQFTLGCMMIIVCLGQTITFYYILIKKRFITLVGYLLSILSLLSSFYQFMPYFYTEFSENEFIWIFDISQFMALNFALCPNFILNQFLQFLFVSSRLFMRNFASVNPFSFILILYLILFWQKEYFRQKHNRNQFFLKEQQKQALFLWDTLIEEKIVLLSYDETWNKIDLVFANSSIKQMLDLDSKEFLKDFRISNFKIDFYQYLLERIHDKTYQFQVKVVHISRKKYVIDCIMNKLIELNISLKFSELQSEKDNQNNYSYLKLLKKIKMIDKQLYYKEIQQHIIKQSYYFKNVTIDQVEQLTLFKLRTFINFIMKNNPTKVLFNLQQFNTILPLVFTLISCLKKLYQIKEIQFIELNQNEANFILIGKEKKKVPPLRIEICKKIINHIVDQVGLYESVFYITQFKCTLVNMSCKIESTPQQNYQINFIIAHLNDFNQNQILINQFILSKQYSQSPSLFYAFGSYLILVIMTETTILIQSLDYASFFSTSKNLDIPFDIDFQYKGISLDILLDLIFQIYQIIYSLFFVHFSIYEGSLIKNRQIYIYIINISTILLQISYKIQAKVC